jgi:hypothetical protein
VASDYALLSAEAQYFALQGVEQALEVIDLARENLNPDLQLLGIVLNIADMRTRHSREAFDSLRTHFQDRLIETPIRASIAYAESAERARSIVDYRPDLGVDYLDVAAELLRRLELEHRGGGWTRYASSSPVASPPEQADLELAHIGAVGLERNPHRRGPALDLSLQGIQDPSGLLELAPDEDTRARAGDRGPQCPQIPGPAEQGG